MFHISFKQHIGFLHISDTWMSNVQIWDTVEGTATLIRWWSQPLLYSLCTPISHREPRNEGGSLNSSQNPAGFYPVVFLIHCNALIHWPTFLIFHDGFHDFCTIFFYITSKNDFLALNLVVIKITTKSLRLKARLPG